MKNRCWRVIGTHLVVADTSIQAVTLVTRSGLVQVLGTDDIETVGAACSIVDETIRKYRMEHLAIQYMLMRLAGELREIAEDTTVLIPRQIREAVLQDDFGPLSLLGVPIVNS